MVIKRTVVLESTDIMRAIKKFLEDRGIEGSKVCNFQLQPNHPDNENSKSQILVIIQDEQL